MTFDEIYRTNAWNGIETRSGPGSHAEPTRRVAEAIQTIVGALRIRSVLDVGCGEGSWMPDLPNYLGIDVSSEAVRAAEERHPYRMYMEWDIAAAPPGQRFDLSIVRDVIQHLSLSEGTALLANLRSEWLLASTYIDGHNISIPTGAAFRPDLEAAPYSLPPALLLIRDGYHYHDGDVIRDPGKMMGLWRL